MLRQHDVVDATFNPLSVSTLVPEARGIVGERIRWTVGWVVETGHYAGQISMIPTVQPDGDPLGIAIGWVPLCDLTDIELVDRLELI